jgi:hypothetical protein
MFLPWDSPLKLSDAPEPAQEHPNLSLSFLIRNHHSDGGKAVSPRMDRGIRCLLRKSLGPA